MVTALACCCQARIPPSSPFLPHHNASRRVSIDCCSGTPPSIPSRRGLSLDQSQSEAGSVATGKVDRARVSGRRDASCGLGRMRNVESGAALASGAAAASVVGMQGAETVDEFELNADAGSQQTQQQSSVAPLADQELMVSAQQAQDMWASSAAPASLSQALIRRTASATASVGAQQLQRTRLTRGPGGGLVMVAALTLAGVLTVVKSTRHSHHHHNPDEACDDCEGCGICYCELCGGSGDIVWEGKLLRNSPCPACLGDGYQKCGGCGGSRVRR